MTMGFLLHAFIWYMLGYICQAKPEAKNPVILVPGLAGSQLFGKLDKPDSPSFYCTKKTDGYIRLWIDVSYLLPFSFNCLTDNIRMIYDPVTRTTRNRDGVDIKVAGWGLTDNIEYLSNVQLGPTMYYYEIVNLLVTKYGYTRNVSIRGAPYDFRKAPNESHEWMRKFKRLIEESFRVNDNKPVMIVAHSLGCLYTLHFLQRQSQRWKDQYIKEFVSVAGPYGGSTMTLKAQASGDNLAIFSIKGLWGRPAQRSSPSGPYLFPKKPFWSQNNVLALTDKRNYTVNDYEQFFKDMNYSLGYEILKDVHNLTDPMIAPGVKVFCVMGRNVPTAAAFDWRGKNFPDDDPSEVIGDGDGTVNWRSLRVCSEWEDKQKQPVYTVVLDKQKHLEIIKETRILNFFDSIMQH